MNMGIVWLIITIVWISVLYKIVGIKEILNEYKRLREKDYWIPLYNRLEFVSWMSKAIIIIPGLIFNIKLVRMCPLTLITSSLLIWASERKGLPTLILFNTIWIGISIWQIIVGLL